MTNPPLYVDQSATGRAPTEGEMTEGTKRLIGVTWPDEATVYHLTRPEREHYSVCGRSDRGRYYLNYRYPESYASERGWILCKKCDAKATGA